MEGRLADMWRLTVNDKNFIKTALLSEIRNDGRKPYEYHMIAIKSSRQVLASLINVIDPTHNEEAVMVGRMTTTVNANGDICAIQNAGGEGIPQRVIMQCLQLPTVKAAGTTKQLKEAIELYNTERALQKIKRHPTSTGVNVKEKQNQSIGK